MTRILLIGGNGKIARLLTPRLLQRGWHVTSIVRDAAQAPGIRALVDQDRQSLLDVVEHSVEESLQSEDQARALLSRTHPDYVVWSAGAGGRGGRARTDAVDRVAASMLIQASAATNVQRFVMVSYLASRRRQPPWWDDAQWAAAQHVNTDVLPDYYAAKLAADETLQAAAKSSSMVALCLRPGALTDEPAGPVTLGKTPTSTGTASRATVADIIDRLLAEPGAQSAWIDLLDGDEDPATAVTRVVAEHVDAHEGEE